MGHRRASSAGDPRHRAGILSYRALRGAGRHRRTRMDPPPRRGAIRKDPGGRLGVALVYPNAERLGMANLGFHAVYRLFNDDPATRCERVFLPEDGGAPRSVESGRRSREFDVVAFSLSFEDDFVHVLDAARPGRPAAARRRPRRAPPAGGGRRHRHADQPGAGGPLPRRRADRRGRGAGAALPRLAARPGRPAARRRCCATLARLPGAYVPGLYEVEYADTRAGGRLGDPLRAARRARPARVARRYVADLSQGGHLAGHRVARRPVRRPLPHRGGARLPLGLPLLRRRLRAAPLPRGGPRDAAGRGAGRGSPPGSGSGWSGPTPATTPASTRSPASSASRAAASARRRCGSTPSPRCWPAGWRPAASAPSPWPPRPAPPRMREVINKDFSDDRIVQAAGRALAGACSHVKLYFMCGLPTETDEDVLGMARLARPHPRGGDGAAGQGHQADGAHHALGEPVRAQALDAVPVAAHARAASAWRRSASCWSASCGRSASTSTS